MTAGNNVTLKLVSISSLVALAAFTVGGWVGDVRATSARHDAELTQLRGIATNIEAMLARMDSRVRSLEDWRVGPRSPADR